MPVELNELLAQEYRRFLDSDEDDWTCTLETGGRDYRFDLDGMTQENVATGMTRSIRMVSNSPGNWTHTPAELMVQRDTQSMWVSETCPDVRRHVEAILAQSSHRKTRRRPTSDCYVIHSAKVDAIWRVENFGLWQKYVQHAKGMDAVPSIDSIQTSASLVQAAQSLRGGITFGHVNEKWLLHGTTGDIIEQVVAQGFDHRCARENGLYGRGTYFAAESCKSHQYTCCCSAGSCRCVGTRYVVLARVALGTPFYTKEACQKIARPPAQPCREASLYDCVVARPGKMKGHWKGYQDHYEFVIFKQEQAYPAYVVEYHV